MKELVDEKFDMDELVANLLGERSVRPKEKKVRLNLGLIDESGITVDGQSFPLPKGVSKLTAAAVKALAGKYRGLILAREGQDGNAVTLKDEDIVHARKKSAFRTQEPAPKFRTLPRLGLD